MALLGRLRELSNRHTKIQNKSIIKDSVHGSMKIRQECVMIIDTPEFQRLRFIKQMGGAYQVFPGASHNRFEHSLGVSYLAERMVETLKKQIDEGQYDDLDYEELGKIDDKDVLCVTLAGLCHDLGHGPFSHTFELAIEQIDEPRNEKLISEWKEEFGEDWEEKIDDDSKKKLGTWKHEKSSVKMFDVLINRVGKKNVGLDEQDLIFIKELMEKPPKSQAPWTSKGREENKSFLYEIVNNAWSGIDVDKWDYFARDSYHLGIPNTFDHERFMRLVRIVKCGEPRRFHICPRDKEAYNVYNMFSTRYMLARRCHSHQVTKAIDLMIRDAIVAAAEATSSGEEGGDAAKEASDANRPRGRKSGIYFTTKANIDFGIREAVEDPDAFIQMTDGLYHMILHSKGEPLGKARRIIERIEKRDIYKCIGQAFIEDKNYYQENKKRFQEELKGLLGTQDLILQVVKMSYGKAELGVDELYFWNSKKKSEAIKLPPKKISKMLPQTFEDVMLYVYVTTSEVKKKQMEQYEDKFRTWGDKRLTVI